MIDGAYTKPGQYGKAMRQIIGHKLLFLAPYIAQELHPFYRTSTCGSVDLQYSIVPTQKPCFLSSARTSLSPLMSCMCSSVVSDNVPMTCEP